MHEENCFLTLTYDPEHLPENNTLVKAHFQKFMKRFRKYIYPKKIRFFHCGEYGSKTQRPHYHAIIFGYDFPDKEVYRKTELGHTLWTSKTLDSIWTLGHAWIGTVTFESAAYVARYVIEKINVSEKSPARIRAMWEGKYVNKVTGEIRQQEYTTMSRRPGIGKDWYDKFMYDIYPKDYAIMRGVKVRPPKYYDGLYELTDPDDFRRLKNSRLKNVRKIDPNEGSPRRLAVKEECKMAQMRHLSRNLEE